MAGTIQADGFAVAGGVPGWKTEPMIENVIECIAQCDGGAVGLVRPIFKYVGKLPRHDVLRHRVTDVAESYYHRL